MNECKLGMNEWLQTKDEWMNDCKLRINEWLQTKDKWMNVN